MNYKFLDKPCRNFCIFNYIFINDPADGRIKLVLSSFTAEGTGRLVFIDALTGGGEAVPLPGDEGAWALCNLDNEKLLVGTCSRYGYLHCLELAQRKWLEPLRDSHETYIWNLVRGSDGKVYGGTYPGCMLLQYDPSLHKLLNKGRMSQNPRDQYSRLVFGDVPGKILINCGFDSESVSEYRLDTGCVQRIFAPGARIHHMTKEFLCIIMDGEMKYVDPDSYEPLDEAQFQQMPGNGKTKPEGYSGQLVYSGLGHTAGVRGQEYFILEKDDRVPEFKKIPALAPETGILTLTCDEDGVIWGSSALGQTIFSYDPVSREVWNSSDVCENGGEVYGMCHIGGRIFMSSYCGGDHIVYDPAKPWNRSDNVNPKVLEPVGPELIRPSGKSVKGPDGAFWTGWMSRYGTYGGGVSRVDPATGEVRSWYDPVPGQANASMAADSRYIYFTTNGYANGLSEKSEPFHIVMWEPSGWAAGAVELQNGVIPGVAAVTGDYLAVSVEDGLWLYECGSLRFIKSINLPGRCSCIVVIGECRLGVFCGDKFLTIEVKKEEKSQVITLPGFVHAAVANKEHRIYFSVKSSLYQLNL